jgi:hypothetical protein
MSETPSDRPDDDVPGDELREHPEDPAEGADPDAEQRPDVPRVHPVDPAEG